MRFPRLRFRLWDRVAKLPGVCVANSYYRVCEGQRGQSVRVDWMCRDDLARNEVCWCGKLDTRTTPALVTSARTAQSDEPSRPIADSPGAG